MVSKIVGRQPPGTADYSFHLRGPPDADPAPWVTKDWQAAIGVFALASMGPLHADFFVEKGEICERCISPNPVGIILR